MTLTRLYERGVITDLQYRAADAWLEDGRPVRRAATRKPARSDKPRDRDIMAAAAVERYKAARRRLEAIGALDDLERALAGEEADMVLAGRGMSMLVVFYGLRER